MGLFGGKTETQSGPASRSSSSSSTGSKGDRAVREERMSEALPEAPTVIGHDSIVKGQIESKTDMLINGRVEGEIMGTKRVIVGEKGDIEAKVRADVVVVRGTVNGDLEGLSKVEITATGKVFGNITSKAIKVAEGATFRGSSKMVRRSEGSRPDAAAPERAAKGAGNASTETSAASKAAPATPSHPS